MNLEPELQAMNKVYEALSELNDDAKARVIDWVLGKFGLGRPKGSFTPGISTLRDVSQGERELSDFESIAEAFAAASPQSTANKALVVAAYLQLSKGGAEISGREINKQLKHMGHGVENITKAVEPLIKQKPQLLIQTRKEGKTRQAQKKYKVTNEGFAVIKKMINPTEDKRE